MATASQIAQLRILIGEPDNVDPWTDAFLGDLIDTATSVDKAAQTVWRSKAAGSAHLVDISEGGSSRKMSDIHKNFLAMAAIYDDAPGTVPTSGRNSRTRPIRRA